MKRDRLIEVSKAYRCPHCRKLYERRHAALEHERHCWFNSNREPKMGEITHDGIHDMLMDWNGEGKAPWYPGERGLCYTPDGWKRVPGYRFGERYANSEEWPEVADTGGWDTTGPGDPAWYPWEGESITFDKIGRTWRAELMDILDPVKGDPEEWGYRSIQGDPFADPYVHYASEEVVA